MRRAKVDMEAAYQARQATFTGGFANFRRATIDIGWTEWLIQEIGLDLERHLQLGPTSNRVC